MKASISTVTVLVALALPFFTESASTVPFVRVVSQGLKDDAIIVSEVSAPKPGWVAVHVENDGEPGEVIGVVPVPAGPSSFLSIRLDLARVAARLVAVLHEDEGKKGAFEFPGPDAAITSPAGPVTSRFVLAGCRGAVNCDIGLPLSPLEAAFQ